MDGMNHLELFEQKISQKFKRMKTQKITNDERFKSNLKKKFRISVDANAGSLI